MDPCVLCKPNLETILWRDSRCRVVLADEPGYAGFLRVVLNRRVKEMTDLGDAERMALMAVVFAAEAALREVMAPDKVNLATLGNLVPHVHWHVIPRFRDDPHFPNAVWGERLREPGKHDAADVQARLTAALNRQLGRAPGSE